jgi:chromosome segregation ATPase
LSGTLEIEAEIAWLKQENVKLDAMILQTRNETERLRKGNKPLEKEIEQIKRETEQIKREAEQIKREAEQIRKDNERLAVLESKIDSSFSKYGINLPLGQIPKQP